MKLIDVLSRIIHMHLQSRTSELPQFCIELNSSQSNYTITYFFTILIKKKKKRVHIESYVSYFTINYFYKVAKACDKYKHQNQFLGK